jgi:hypothetical protein
MLGGLGEKLGGMFTSCRSWRLTKVLTKAGSSANVTPIRLLL